MNYKSEHTSLPTYLEMIADISTPWDDIIDAPIPEGFVRCYPLHTHAYLVECVHEYCGDCTACDPDLFPCIGRKKCYNYTPEEHAYAITKKLSPKVITYCKHKQGEKTADVEIPWEDVHLICGATGERCIMGMYCNCLCCKFEFTSFARHINGRCYLTRPLDPQIVTYCAHVKGAKALNLPF